MHRKAKRSLITTDILFLFNKSLYFALHLEQPAEYMDKSHATEGHLILFDRKTDKPWEERIYQRQEQVHGKTITVWGM